MTGVADQQAAVATGHGRHRGLNDNELPHVENHALSALIASAINASASAWTPGRCRLAKISPNGTWLSEMRHRCPMASQKIPSPKDLKAAAQSAAETAQAAATGALRITPATMQLLAEVPDLIENLAAATERLNSAIDRAERYLALAEPMIRTTDALLPQLEMLVNTGNDVFRAASAMPGVAAIGRLAGRGADASRESKPAKPKPRRSKS